MGKVQSTGKPASSPYRLATKFVKGCTSAHCGQFSLDPATLGSPLKNSIRIATHAQCLMRGSTTYLCALRHVKDVGCGVLAVQVVEDVEGGGMRDAEEGTLVRGPL